MENDDFREKKNWKMTIFDVSYIWNLFSSFCPNHMLIPYFCRVFVIFFEKLQNEVEQLHFPQNFGVFWKLIFLRICLSFKWF